MGRPDDFREGWTWAQMPAGPQPIPSWCKGARISWWEGWGNPPEARLKTNEEARDWADKEFVQEGSYYRAFHEDGRLVQHHHTGALTWDEARGAWISEAQEGYGGCAWPLTMKEEGQFVGDRRQVVLVGPWDVASPEGYVGVVYVNTVSHFFGRGTPWHQRGGIGGLRLKSEVLLRIVARFEPTVRLALVRRRWMRGTLSAEFVRSDWNAPKGMRPEDFFSDAATLANPADEAARQLEETA